MAPRDRASGKAYVTLSNAMDITIFRGTKTPSCDFSNDRFGSEVVIVAESRRRAGVGEKLTFSYFPAVSNECSGGRTADCTLKKVIVDLYWF